MGGPARGSRPEHLLDSPRSVLNGGWAGAGTSRAQAPRSASFRPGWRVTATGRGLEGTRERQGSRALTLWLWWSLRAQLTFFLGSSHRRGWKPAPGNTAPPLSLQPGAGRSGAEAPSHLWYVNGGSSGRKNVVAGRAPDPHREMKTSSNG